MNQERVEHGRALVTGDLGGAAVPFVLAELIGAIQSQSPILRRPESWPARLLESLAAVDILAERNATQAATISGLNGQLAEQRAAADSAILAEQAAKREAREAKAEREAAERDAGIAYLEAEELRDVLAPLAAILAELPLAVLASRPEAGKLAALYLRAEVLTAETPAERRERLAAKL